MGVQNPDDQDRISALLLAGIRAALLWRQCGGSRWQVLLGRRKMLDAARAYLWDTESVSPADARARAPGMRTPAQRPMPVSRAVAR